MLNIVNYLLTKCELTKHPLHILDKYDKIDINIFYEDYKSLVFEYPELYALKNNQSIYIRKWDAVVIPNVTHIDVNIYYNNVKKTNYITINRIFNGNNNISGIYLRQIMNIILFTKKEYNLINIEYHMGILSLFYDLKVSTDI